MIVLQNDLIGVSISETNGAVVGLEDRTRNLQFMDGKPGVPFRLDTGSELVTRYDSFSSRIDAAFTAGTAYLLTWIIGDGLTLEARVELERGSDQVSFTSKLENRGSTSILAVEYPIIGGMRSIGPNDALVHSYATGLMVRNPLKSFTFDGDGLRFMPYPESFSGASMQFYAYYSPGKGGLYFAAYDGAYAQKWLNFYRMNGRLEASLMYGYQDVGAGRSLVAPFKYVVKIFPGDDWYQAADIYKAWAIRQDWCAQGTLADRGKQGTASWLLDNVGLTTFGIDASHDRTRWIRKYHDDIGSPIFHVLGPDWPKENQNFYNSVPGGLADWFPTRFSQENLREIRNQGDYFAPFEFDFLVDPNKSDGDRLRKNLQMFPAKPRSTDAYAFTMLCPSTEFTRTFHVQRDVRVYEEAGVDGMYYDISANNLIKTCFSPDHGHPVGGGQEITLAYKRIYNDTKKALSERAGKYMPLGTEMMCEVFLPEIDYYQARAWAQPSAAFETWPFRTLMKSGQAEMVPLFTYVYHEYGPVRMDGWGKLVSQTGELFYNIAAKTYLWGGLYEINHEYSPMEALDGVETSPAEHYFKFDPQGFAYDAERARYLAQFAALRTGRGNRYLAYGTMLRPLDIGATDTKMSWFHYNSGQTTKEYRDRGTIKVPGVVHSAWRQGEGASASYAFIFANTEGKEVGIAARVDRDLYGMTGIGWKMRLLTGFGKNGRSIATEMGRVPEESAVPLTLKIAARDVSMIEFYRD